MHGRRDLARLDGQFGGDALYDLECYGFRHVVDDLPAEIAARAGRPEAAGCVAGPTGQMPRVSEAGHFAINGGASSRG
ncbi:hypothetical protein BCEP4_440011 [Burkholderia cepacia]|nr:hypothetical protein BCEP4_440011 [Burkholderia cepacia]